MPSIQKSSRSAPSLRWSRRLSLFEAFEVLGELLLGREGGPVDALQHRVRLVAAPVGARGVGQLEGADLVGALYVRAAAQVGEFGRGGRS